MGCTQSSERQTRRPTNRHRMIDCASEPAEVEILDAPCDMWRDERHEPPATLPFGHVVHTFQLHGTTQLPTAREKSFFTLAGPDEEVLTNSVVSLMNDNLSKQTKRRQSVHISDLNSHTRTFLLFNPALPLYAICCQEDLSKSVINNETSMVPPFVWCFYNDTQDATFKVTARLRPQFDAEGLGKATQLSSSAGKWDKDAKVESDLAQSLRSQTSSDCDKGSEGKDNVLVLSLTVHPGCTEPFFKIGKPSRSDGMVCSDVVLYIEAVPVEPSYFQGQAQDTEAEVSRHLHNLRSLAAENEAEEGNRYIEDEDAVFEGISAKYGIPFVDPLFPPDPTSFIDRSDNTSRAQLITTGWMRPRDMLHSLSLLSSFELSADTLTHSIRPYSVGRGHLGATGFLRALSTLSEYPVMIKNLFSGLLHHSLLRQDGDKRSLSIIGNSSDSFNIRLCVDGWWRDYKVDTFIPAVGGRPYYVHDCLDPRSLWASYIEKAAAKALGSYASLPSLHHSDAFEMLSGLPSSDVSWASLDEAAIFNLLATRTLESQVYYSKDKSTAVGVKENCCMSALVPANKKNNSMGLDTSLTYNVLQIVQFSKDFFVSQGLPTPASCDSNSSLTLVKLRNPSLALEGWTGAWGNSDTQSWSTFQSISSICCCSCNRSTTEDDQEGNSTFWMPLPNVVKQFKGMISYYCPTSTLSTLSRVPQHRMLSLWRDVRVKGQFLPLNLKASKRFQKGSDHDDPYSVLGTFTYVSDIVLEITVAVPTRVILVLTSRSTSGTNQQRRNGKDNLGSLMVSAAGCIESSKGDYVYDRDKKGKSKAKKAIVQQPKKYSIIANSSLDPTRPSAPELFSFLQKKETSMLIDLEPTVEESSPYLVIPRRLGHTTSSNTNDEPVDFTLGVIMLSNTASNCSTVVPSVQFKDIRANSSCSSAVYANNHTQFLYDGGGEAIAEYQVNAFGSTSQEGRGTYVM